MVQFTQLDFIFLVGVSKHEVLHLNDILDLTLKI